MRRSVGGRPGFCSPESGDRKSKQGFEPAKSEECARRPRGATEERSTRGVRGCASGEENGAENVEEDEEEGQGS